MQTNTTGYGGYGCLSRAWKRGGGGSGFIRPLRDQMRPASRSIETVIIATSKRPSRWDPEPPGKAGWRMLRTFYFPFAISLRAFRLAFNRRRASRAVSPGYNTVTFAPPMMATPVTRMTGASGSVVEVAVC